MVRVPIKSTSPNALNSPFRMQCAYTVFQLLTSLIRAHTHLLITISSSSPLPQHRSVVVITSSGYIKRMPMKEFDAQQRGGKGKIGARLSTDEDRVAQFFSCNDHDTLLFTTDRCVSE